MKTFTVFLLGATLLAGCNDRDDENSLTTARSEVRQRAESTVADVDRAMESMRSQLVNATAEAKDSLQSKLDDLQDVRNDLSDKLNKLNAATKDEWQDFRKDMNKTIKDVEKTLRER